MLKNEFEKQGNFLFRYRSYLPLVILLVGFAVFVSKKIQLADAGRPFPENSYMIVCLFVALFGEAIRVFTVGFTPANTSGRNRYKQVADEVNTTGIYSVVRHPLYLGNFFTWLGFAMPTANLWFIGAFIFMYWIYYERIMFAEEMFLYKKFGEKYKKWANETPAFIPSLKKYKKPALPFSWKKVLKKEKNGFAGIFIIFFLFNLTSHIIDGNTGKYFIVFDFWFYAALISSAIYLVLKYLKRRTSVLDEEGR